jgi:hypothetical protein
VAHKQLAALHDWSKGLARDRNVHMAITKNRSMNAHAVAVIVSK